MLVKGSLSSRVYVTVYSLLKCDERGGGGVNKSGPAGYPIIPLQNNCSDRSHQMLEAQGSTQPLPGDRKI